MGATLINPQLEAVLVQFRQQPGTSAEQEAQLRSAITSDGKLLKELNQAAQAGQLRGFSAPSSDPSPNHVGRYDIANGIVTLPHTAFQQGSHVASTDLKAVLQVQEMSIRFAHGTPQPPTQDMLDNLQSTLNASPVLAEEIKRAATTRDPSAHPPAMLLENFAFVPPGLHVGGNYDASSHAINLPARSLQSPSAASPQGIFDPDNLTFVMGHEVQHAFNHPAKAQATSKFTQDVRRIAQSAAVTHDYTAPVREYVQAGREDEARAEIAGWNALLSRQQQTIPQVSLQDMLAHTSAPARDRVADFVKAGPVPGTAVAKPGLTFNPDNSLSPTPANIAAMGQHYFNRPDPASAQPGQNPVGLGESGKADYPNFYGTWAVETIIEAERQHALHHPGVIHRLTLDMTSLGLKEHLIEQEGLEIRTRKATPQPYYDSSQSPSVLHHFDHTQDGSVSPAHDHQSVPIASAIGANAHIDQQLKPQDQQVFDRLRHLLGPELADAHLVQAVADLRSGGLRNGDGPDKAMLHGGCIHAVCDHTSGFARAKTPVDGINQDMGTAMQNLERANAAQQQFEQQYPLNRQQGQSPDLHLH